jgi:hypothetical protein
MIALVYSKILPFSGMLALEILAFCTNIDAIMMFSVLNVAAGVFFHVSVFASLLEAFFVLKKKQMLNFRVGLCSTNTKRFRVVSVAAKLLY